MKTTQPLVVVGSLAQLNDSVCPDVFQDKYPNKAGELAMTNESYSCNSASCDLGAGTLSNMSLTARWRQLFAGSIGNVLEFYDFVVYAFLATMIAQKFFPHENETAGLLAAFAAFGVGFLARPLGGAIIGRIADRSGRRVALLITIFGMAIGTIGIGILPTFASIGLMAPILLVVMRLIQGLAAGGEWGSATSFIIESAPAGRRGWFGSIGQAAISASIMLGSIVVATVTDVLPTGALHDWGWRVPFLLGGVLLIFGFWMRVNIEETPAFKKAQVARSASPVVTVGSLVLMAKAFGFTVLWTISYYVMLSYMPTFLVRHAGVTTGEALWGNSVALLILVVTTPLFGLLSDRIGRKPLLLSCCLAFVILPWPLFTLILNHASVTEIIGIQIIFNLFIAAFSGAGPAAVVELFPTHSRTMLLSIGYSLSVAVFGGFAPFISTWLIATTGTPIAPVFYLIAAGVVSGIVILGFRETARENLL